MIKEVNNLSGSTSKEKDLISFIRENLIEGKAEDIVEVSVDENFSEFDHLVIASGSSNRQVIFLAEKLMEQFNTSVMVSPVRMVERSFWSGD